MAHSQTETASQFKNLEGVSRLLLLKHNVLVAVIVVLGVDIEVVLVNIIVFGVNAMVLVADMVSWWLCDDGKRE